VGVVCQAGANAVEKQMATNPEYIAADAEVTRHRAALEKMRERHRQELAATERSLHEAEKRKEAARMNGWK